MGALDLILTKREYLEGSFSVADVAVGACLLYITAVMFPDLDLTPWPHVLAYMQRRAPLCMPASLVAAFAAFLYFVTALGGVGTFLWYPWLAKDALWCLPCSRLLCCWVVPVLCRHNSLHSRLHCNDMHDMHHAARPLDRSLVTMSSVVYSRFFVNHACSIAFEHACQCT
jgi:hypothetical protein